MPKLVFEMEELPLVPSMGRTGPLIDAAAEVDYDETGAWALSDVGVVTDRVGKTSTIVWLDPVACRRLREVLFENFYREKLALQQRVDEKLGGAGPDDNAEHHLTASDYGLRFARAL